MLWTAPPPARECHECGCLLRVHDSEELDHAIDHDNWSRLVPQHHRMRAIDRDLIRGGHYGQRSCEPHTKAEHMAAPTKAAIVRKVLANSEPSTHGTKRTWRQA